MSQFQDGVAYEGKGPLRLVSGGGGRVVKPARAGDPHCARSRIASTCSVPSRASTAAIMVVSLVETPVTSAARPRSGRIAAAGAFPGCGNTTSAFKNLDRPRQRDQDDAPSLGRSRVLAVRWREEVVARLQPVPTDLEVAFEDEDLLAARMIVGGEACAGIKPE